MRKIRPQDVVDDFVAQLNSLQEYFDRVEEALEGTATAQGDLSTLAEQSFVTSAVAFEGFLSDVFLAFLNRNSSRLFEDYQNRIRSSVESKYKKWIADRVQVTSIQHIDVTTLRELIDDKGWNITFKDAADLKQKAQQQLAEPFRAWIAELNEADDDVVNGVKSIRDFIAHRSVDSKSRMNVSLEQLGVYVENDGLGRGLNLVHHVGAYLKAVIPANGNRRIEQFWVRLREIAEWLRPENG